MRLAIIGYKPERLERTIIFCACGGKYSIYKQLCVNNVKRHSKTKRHILYLKKNNSYQVSALP